MTINGDPLFRSSLFSKRKNKVKNSCPKKTQWWTHVKCGDEDQRGKRWTF